MQLATTLWSKSATFHVQLGVLSCTVNRACVSALLGRSVHVVVSLRKSTTDTYLWGRPDSGCLTRARYRHLTRPSSSCEGRLRQTTWQSTTSPCSQALLGGGGERAWYTLIAHALSITRNLGDRIRAGYRVDNEKIESF